MKHNTNFSTRLNLCLDNEGFPPKNRGRIQLLAEMVGLSHRGASKWINGESKPPAKKISSLAKKLNVNETWLKTGEGNMVDKPFTQTKKNAQNIIEVPIYELDSILSEEKIIKKYISCALTQKEGYYGLILDTEAMSPRFPNGSIIIFDNSKAKDGDFVLVNYNSFPCPIFRQLFIIDEVLYLNAHNPKFDRLTLNNPNKIIGKLIQAILLFE